MASIGTHASHEQVAPSALLSAMRDAEAAGFERAWSSDHFSPEPAKHVRPEDVRGAVLVSADLGRHAEWLNELTELGFDAIYLHHVGRDQRAFIGAFGEHVLPRL